MRCAPWGARAVTEETAQPLIRAGPFFLGLSVRRRSGRFRPRLLHASPRWRRSGGLLQENAGALDPRSLVAALPASGLLVGQRSGLRHPGPEMPARRVAGLRPPRACWGGSGVRRCRGRSVPRQSGRPGTAAQGCRADRAANPCGPDRTACRGAARRRSGRRRVFRRSRWTAGSPRARLRGPPARTGGLVRSRWPNPSRGRGKLDGRQRMRSRAGFGGIREAPRHDLGEAVYAVTIVDGLGGEPHHLPDTGSDACLQDPQRPVDVELPEL